MTPYVPNCATPLLFESDFEEAPYWMAGTGFLIDSNSKYFFLTAKHCLRPGDAHKIRLPRSFDSDELLRFGQYGHPELPEGEEDTDWGQMAAFSVQPDTFGRDVNGNALEPARLPNIETRHLLREEIALTVRGYPKAAPLSYIDPDGKTISIQALTTDAKFIRYTDTIGCYELQFMDECPIDDFDFMSGSPVFAKLLHQGRLFYVLVGMMLRAGGVERLGRFLTIEIFKQCRHRYDDLMKDPRR